MASAEISQHTIDGVSQGMHKQVMLLPLLKWQVWTTDDSIHKHIHPELSDGITTLTVVIPGTSSGSLGGLVVSK